MMLSLVTAYRSFGGEVEASSTPTICRLSDSRRHQLWVIALDAQVSPELALQLRSWNVSESIDNHDSEIVDAGGVDRRDACVVGGVASRGQAADTSVVHARACGDECRPVPGRSARR